jgi:hypothetical protein
MEEAPLVGKVVTQQFALVLEVAPSVETEMAAPSLETAVGAPSLEK